MITIPGFMLVIDIGVSRCQDLALLVPRGDSATQILD